MSRNLVITIIVILVLLAGGWYLLRPKETAVPSPEPTSAPTSTESASPSSATDEAMMTEETVVKITAAGFSPKDITIKAGETVTWMNEDTAMHNVSSAPHPTHTDYTPLNLGNVPAGAKVSLKFPEAGTYKYHDHLNPTLTGTVVVE